MKKQKMYYDFKKCKGYSLKIDGHVLPAWFSIHRSYVEEWLKMANANKDFGDCSPRIVKVEISMKQLKPKKAKKK